MNVAKIDRGKQDPCGPDVLGPSPSQSMPTAMPALHRDSVTSELEFLQRRVRELENKAQRMSAEREDHDIQTRRQEQQRHTPDHHSPLANRERSPPIEITIIEEEDDDIGSGDSVEGQDGDDIESDTEGAGHPDKRRDTSDTVIKDAASILEFLAWGRRKDPEYHPTTTGRRNSVGDGSTTAVLSTAGTVGTNLGMSMSMIPMLDETDELNDTAFGEFGTHYHHHGNGQAPSNSDPFNNNGTQSPLAVMQMLLSSRRQVEQLVDYHIECLLWYHASFLAPRFKADLAAFYNRFDGQVHEVEEHRGIADLDLQWAALLFSVISGSLTCVPAQQALAWGFRAQERHALCKHWFQASLACLARDQYMANHSVRSCQAIATMTISAHMLGFSNTQSIQLAAAVRIAQSLGLHRLGEGDGPVAADIEQGRRVWNQLCSQDVQPGLVRNSILRKLPRQPTTFTDSQTSKCA